MDKQIKERGIIFNGEMVRAILNGRKTQTRRIISPQPELTEGSGFSWKGALFGAGSDDRETNRNFAHCRCPFGKVGDRLWVRETFCEVDDSIVGWEKWVDYRATPKFNEKHPAGWDCDPKDPEALKWKSASQMPRRLSRITLEITDIRVERLQAITLGDICKEMGCGLYDFRPATHGFSVWEDTWKSIYGQDSWQSNPFVWVIEFKRVEAA